jgi:2-hydroxy-3-oxopropionate reductase
MGLSLPNTATAQGLFNSRAAHGGKAWDHSAFCILHSAFCILHSALVRALEIMANYEIGAPVPQ